MEEPSKLIDLRSDTVTRPSAGMREAMRNAEVGDDVNGDDPTVICLQERVANLLGKEAGLFVPSGTMSNAVAVRTHTQPGDEIVTEEDSHLYVYEGGGYAALSGCSIALVPAERGIMNPEDIARKIRKSEGSRSHYPNGRLVCVENTSNRGGGTCYPIDTLDEIGRIAREKECNLHLDGARLFNAVAASGESPERLTSMFESVSVCLSKGLGAPVGSVLVGSSEFINRAHRWRKIMGGGMRQSGILAAAGLYALDHNLERLEVDHQRARKLAESLAVQPGLSVDLDAVQTNMVYLQTEKAADEWVNQLEERGVQCFALGQNLLRLVVHLDLEENQIDRAIEIFSQLAET